MIELSVSLNRSSFNLNEKSGRGLHLGRLSNAVNQINRYFAIPTSLSAYA